MELTMQEKINVLKNRIKLNELYLEFETISQNEDAVEKYKYELSELKSKLRSIIIEDLLQE
jgi:hypothetical protein